MLRIKFSSIMMIAGLIAFSAGPVLAQASSSQTTKTKRHHKHQNNVASQNSLPDSNPNQKIEDAPAGQNVDQGTAQDFEDMNTELNADHKVNHPK